MEAIDLAHSTVTVPSLPAGWQIVTIAALPDGSLGLLGTDVDLAGSWARVWRQEAEPLPPDSPDRPQPVAARGTARLWRFDGDVLHDGPTLPLEHPSLVLAGLPDGRWLVSATNGRDGPNARLIAADGTVTTRLHLGDAIETVVADAAGRLWVGWFDEGVFGSINSAIPGLVDQGLYVAGCFDTTGRLLPVSPMLPEAGLCADIYALTAVGDAAWLCPYTEFPLIRLSPGEPACWWRNDIAGASAMAVDGRHVLLAGGYGADADRLAVLELDGTGNGETARLLSSWRLPLIRTAFDKAETQTGRPVWERPTLLAGYGDLLHLVVDGVWWRWRVGDVVSAGVYQPPLGGKTRPLS